MSLAAELYTEYSLSAISAVEFEYFFNKKEKFSGNYYSYNNGFGHYTYDAFENFKDANLSKRNCIILTDKIPLKDILDVDARHIPIGVVAGSFYLKTYSGKYLTLKDNQIYAGGVGEKILITVAPVSGNLVELKIGKSKYIQIQESYPFTAIVSEESLQEESRIRQMFEVDYKNKKICFKTKTQQGYRFLSHGVDMTLRGVGLMLNETSVNSYLFTPEFLTADGVYYDFDAITNEIRYYNDLFVSDDRRTVKVKQKAETVPHLLITASTIGIAKTNKANSNISLTKTNFSSSGTYSNKEQT